MVASAPNLSVAEAAGAPVVHVALLALEAEGLLVVDAPLARLLVRRVVLLLRPVLQLREALRRGAAPSNLQASGRPDLSQGARRRRPLQPEFDCDATADRTDGVLFRLRRRYGGVDIARFAGVVTS